MATGPDSIPRLIEDDLTFLHPGKALVEQRGTHQHIVDTSPDLAVPKQAVGQFACEVVVARPGVPRACVATGNPGVDDARASSPPPPPSASAGEPELDLVSSLFTSIGRAVRYTPNKK